MADGKIHDLDEGTQAAAPAVQDDMRQENGDGTVTITLKHPVRARFRVNNQDREEEISELRVRRANGGDLRMVMRLKNDEEKLMVTLFTNLTGRPAPVFDQLDADDILRFYDEVQRFLPQSPETGPKS